MGPYVWCVIGVVLGWVAGAMGGNPGFTDRIEMVAVGIFGAFFGGEFISAMLFRDAAAQGLNATTIALAVASCVVALALLSWMRKAVGPLKAGRRKKRGAG